MSLLRLGRWYFLFLGLAFCGCCFCCSWLLTCLFFFCILSFGHGTGQSWMSSLDQASYRKDVQRLTQSVTQSVS
jgi:hypothetical protein